MLTASFASCAAAACSKGRSAMMSLPRPALVRQVGLVGDSSQPPHISASCELVPGRSRSNPGVVERGMNRLGRGQYPYPSHFSNDKRLSRTRYMFNLENGLPPLCDLPELLHDMFVKRSSLRRGAVV